MKYKLYCLYDKVAQEAGPVFTAKNDGIASRMVRQLIKSEQVENAEDIILYDLAEYDDEKIQVFVYSTLKSIPFNEKEIVEDM